MQSIPTEAIKFALKLKKILKCELSLSFFICKTVRNVSQRNKKQVTKKLIDKQRCKKEYNYTQIERALV